MLSRGARIRPQREEREKAAGGDSWAGKRNSAAERRMRESGRQRQQGKWQEFGRKGKNERKWLAETAGEVARIRPQREEREKAAGEDS